MSALGEGLGGSERASRVSRVDPGELPTRRRGGRHTRDTHGPLTSELCGSCLQYCRHGRLSRLFRLCSKIRGASRRGESRADGARTRERSMLAICIESTTCLCERSRHSHVHRTQTCFFCGEFASTVGSGEACSRPLRTPTLRHCRHNAQTRRHLLGANIVVYGSYSCPSTAMRS